jgi:hypothetical protein
LLAHVRRSVPVSVSNRLPFHLRSESQERQYQMRNRIEWTAAKIELKRTSGWTGREDDDFAMFDRPFGQFMQIGHRP